MSKTDQASARLRYLVNRIAAECGPTNSLKSVGEKVGINYSTILSYIERGTFSESLASKFEATFDIPAHWLLHPMEIDGATGSDLHQEFKAASLA